MPHRKTHDSRPAHAKSPAEAPSPMIETSRRSPRSKVVLAECRVLLATDSESVRERIMTMLDGRVLEIASVSTAVEARSRLDQMRAYDVLLVHDHLHASAALLTHAAATRKDLVSIYLAEAAALDEAVLAMQAGAADVLSPSLTPTELIAKIESSLRRRRDDRDLHTGVQRRADRLVRLCRVLNSQRRELMSQVVSLCDDLYKAYEELAGQLERGTFAGAFNALVRQDLDVESLLRTVLEHLLPQTGPTNAAIFLPASSGDFTLGAYINHDRPRADVEMTLDTLAATLAPAFERHTAIEVFENDDALARHIASDADWLKDCTSAVIPCRHEGECLAVLLLFRDSRVPYPTTLIPTLETVRDVFAAQLARIISTHHRHKPSKELDFLDGMDFDTDWDDDSHGGFDGLDDLAA